MEPDMVSLVGGSQQDRCRGLLLGLAAGDRNGGPIQMALVLAESLAAKKRYDPAEVFCGYDEWWAEGHGVDAWDTGPTTGDLLAYFRRQGYSKSRPPSVQELEGKAQKLDLHLKGMTAGVNAAHRVTPLALAGFLGDIELTEAARQESRLTHWSPISQNTCAVVAALARYLVAGSSWQSALNSVLRNDSPLIMHAIQRGQNAEEDLAGIRNGGFCPDVLTATVRFVCAGVASESFDTALSSSLKFAGPCNYCPVLVGALTGAVFGASQIDARKHLGHCRPGVQERCIRAADQLLTTLIETEETRNGR